MSCCSFKDWCYKQFAKIYQLILNRVFQQPAAIS